MMRIFLWGLIILIILFTWFCINPILWQSEDKVTVGSTITLDGVSDFALIVDYSAIPQSPSTFDKMDFSLSWLNTLQQEIGPTTLIDAEDFEKTNLDNFRVVILTASTSKRDAWTPKLRGFLERGGTLVMEMPTGALRTIASADGKGEVRNAQNITYAAGVPESLSSAMSLLDLSNRTTLIGSSGPLEDSTTFLMIDGVPVIYSKKYATGNVITIDFNYGMLLTSLQQGRPLDNFSIRNFRDTTSIETSDLAVSSELSLETPLADVLERFVIYGVIDAVTPVTGFWPFFDGMMGALLVTHNENHIGDRSTWMSEYESTFKATSTLFVNVPPALSTDGIAALRKYHTEIALAFDLSAKTKAIVKPSVLPFSPFLRKLSLNEQALELKSALGENITLTTSQSVNGLWSSHYTRSFRMIAAAGFLADTSYRSALDRPGYSFMTGLPFLPIDTNGKLFNVLEFPITHPVIETEEDIQNITSYLEKSETSMHECLGVSFDTDFFIEKPSLDTYRAWRSLYRIAHDHKHWLTGAYQFLRFSRARQNGELKSKLTTMTVNHKKVKVLRLETLAPESGMSLSIPQTVGTSSFVEARRGVHRVREDILLSDTVQTTPISVFGFDRVLLPLSKGFNAVDIIYE